MKVFRQLGSCGSMVIFTPILWLAACWASRAMSQHAYDRQIVPKTRNHRVAAGPIPEGGTSVKDRRVRTELEKYLRIWNLEPGACAAFPDAARYPFSFNPFQAKATFMRLKQKQAFLLSQQHRVSRVGDTWFIEPDPKAALGGRRFRVDATNGNLREAWEYSP